MVTITVKIDDSCDMAVVNDGCGNCIEGNFWDFHNGCHGDDLPEYNDIEEYIEVLKTLHISKGEEVKVVRTTYECGY